MFKGRPEPVAPPAKERKNFSSSRPKAESEEPAAEIADKPDGDADESED